MDKRLYHIGFAIEFAFLLLIAPQLLAVDITNPCDTLPTVHGRLESSNPTECEHPTATPSHPHHMDL